MSAAAAPAAAPRRPVRQAAVAHRYSDMKLDGGGFEGDTYDGGNQYAAANGAAPPPGARVDLAKLSVQKLRKYTKVYGVPGVSPQSSKEDLAGAVQSHWDAQAVSEEAVLNNLMRVRGRF